MCLQGASAIEKILKEEHDPKIRVFVVWEPVLPTDLGAPSTVTLSRVSDLRASQYWDKGHLISRSLGERDRRSVIWDYVAVYPPGALWDKAPPQPLYSHAPVVRSVEGTKDALRQALQRLAAKASLCAGDRRRASFGAPAVASSCLQQNYGLRGTRSHG